MGNEHLSTLNIRINRMANNGDASMMLLEG